MNIEIADNITEGTEYEIRVNGRRAYVGIAEHDDEAEDIANGMALSLYSKSLEKPITITATAL